MDLSESQDGCSLADLPTRPMRVKILYTLDTESKTTCLARLPDTLPIPVVAIDEQSQLGVIDLQQCIQAVISASPEIMSKLDNGDFAIYTFDYSESDVPLVGQGRLSTRLAAFESAQLTGQLSDCMITGRVCKNVPFLFSNGVKETLEVKLRLIPISRPNHHEYGRGGEGARSLSPATSAGFDPNAWHTSTKQTRGPDVSSDFFGFTGQSNDEASAALLADIFGPESGNGGLDGGLQQISNTGIPGTPADSSVDFNPAFAAHSRSAPGSRTGSPMIRPEGVAHSELTRHQSFSGDPYSPGLSRPGSRGNHHLGSTGPSQAEIDEFRSAQQQSRQQALPQAEMYYNEDGQPRKRAKVMQTNWSGRSSFGAKPSDLRVSAATAASLQMHRPIPRRSTAAGRDLEPPPRVPTPIPQINSHQRLQNHRNSRSVSMLRQASTTGSEFMSDFEPMSDAASSDGSSPGNSITADGTPMDFPSSPPVLQNFNHVQPSSPGLPTSSHAIFADSGYMSERGFQSTICKESQEEDVVLGTSAMSAMSPGLQFSNEMNVQLEQPGDMNQLPQKMLLNLPQGRRDGGQRSQSPHLNLSQQQSHAPRPATPLSRRSSLALPTNPMPLSRSQSSNSSESTTQVKPTLQRSLTLPQGSEAESPALSDTDCRPRGTSRSGSSAPRRKVIQQRLEKSIANGETPIFCVHCGAIETPTWRRIYVKECSGKPSPLDSVEGEGETIGIQVTERDDTTGEPAKFVIRKSVRKTKDTVIGEGFKESTVCNPCGLWFTKFRNMRPSNKWSRKSSSRKLKKPKTEDCPATDGIEPASEAFFTDQIMPEESPEAELPPPPPTVAPPSREDVANDAPRRNRSNSLQHQRPSLTRHAELNATNTDGMPLRATQSSPARFQGSQASPIELDLTPKPTRRLLFPSPRQAGELKTLEGADLPSEKSSRTRRSAKSASAKDIGSSEPVDLNVFDAFTFDKENFAPPLDDVNDLAHLFDGSPTAFLRTPTKKTPSRKSSPGDRPYDHLLKTPTPGSRKRKILTPNRSSHAANSAEARGAPDFMTSPSSARYFLRSTPSRLERTPGGRSNQSNPANPLQEISPFSRHLAQMLCDTDNTMAVFTSPSRQYDFSDLPTFTSPTREAVWKGIDDMLSSEFAVCDEQMNPQHRK